MPVHATIEPVHEPSARSNAAYATAVDTSSVASGLTACAWRPAPGELVSLWDMLQAYAYYFVRLTELLAEMGEHFKRLQETLLDPEIEDDKKTELAHVTPRPARIKLIE